MKAWFQSLAVREQRIVVVGGAVVIVILVYLLAIEPLANAFARHERRVQTLGEQLTSMQEAATQVQRLRASGAEDSAGSDDRPPYLAVDAALRGAGLPQPQRLEPVGDGKARLEFDEVPFDPLVRIIGRLHSESGLQVTRARIERTESAGQVGARLTFERAEQ